MWMLFRSKIRRSSEQLRARLEERHAERERIARELHDTFLQGVQGLVLRFQAISQTIPEEDPARSKMNEALYRADMVLSEGRDRVLDLRSPNASNISLLGALSRVGREIEQYSNCKFTTFTKGTWKPLNPEVQDELYWIGHEAISNAFIHSGGQLVTLIIVYGQYEFELIIIDNGDGIDPTYMTPLGRPSHWGLCGMHERASNIGAKLTIEKATPCGTHIRLSIPTRSAYQNHLACRIPFWQWLRMRRS